MRVILYMATTANGMIATLNDETPWSDEEWQAYSDIVKKTGALIVGRRTYQLMLADGSFTRLENPFVVVVTKNTKFAVMTRNHISAFSVRGALQLTEQKGFSEVIVGGGGKLNGSMMKAGVVDELYLDIEPIIFGKGIPVFSAEFQSVLELLEIKKLNTNTLQLHYQVRK